jgi:hypothetical protein
MKKTIKTLAIGLAAVALMSATSVQASWSQFFYENGNYGIPAVHSQFDKITATITGSTFDTPYGYVAANPDGTGLSGWTSLNTLANTMTFTSGTPVDSLYFWGNFSGTAATAFVIDERVWLGSTLIGIQMLNYDGTGDPNNSWAYAEVPVPEPTTMVAGALLLLPFGASTIRRMRKSRTA